MITEAEKDFIRAERASGLKLIEVGHRHGITRERVRQICLEPPNEAKRARELALGLGVFVAPAECVEELQVDEEDCLIVRFKNLDLRHLEDIQLQRKVRAEVPNYRAISRKYGITLHAVRRIRKHKDSARPKSGYSLGQYTSEQRSAMADRGWVTRRRRSDLTISTPPR